MLSYVGISICLFLITPCLFIEYVQGECCGFNIRVQCDDCSDPTPCCGRGPCNAFCCNCDDGCRPGYCRKKREVSSNSTMVDESDVGNIVKALDKNGDGLISVMEGFQHLTIKFPDFTENTLMTEIMKLDLDRDGFLSSMEIDRDEL